MCTDNWVGGNVCDSAATVKFRPDPASPTTPPRSLNGSATFHPGYNPSWLDQQVENDYAIIKLGNKQHKVRNGEFLVVDRVHIDEGKSFEPDVVFVQ